MRPRAILAVLASWPLSELLNRAFELELRETTAALAAILLGIAGMTVERAGTLLTTATGRFDVLLPCSGGKFLAATLALGAALAMTSELGRGRRAIVALTLVPLALAGNSLRVAGLVMLGAERGPWVHTALGAWCFAIVGLALLALTRVKASGLGHGRVAG